MDLIAIFGEELAEQIKSKLPEGKELMLNDGSYVPKSRLKELSDTIKTLKSQYADTSKMLDDFKAKYKDSEELQTKITEMQEQIQNQQKEYENKLVQTKLNTGIEIALTKAGAKNIKAVKALLNTEAIKLDGDTIIGLGEQIDNLKKNETYLFNDGKKVPPANTGGKVSPNTNNPFSKEYFNLTKQIELQKTNPELAARLQKEAQ